VAVAVVAVRAAEASDDEAEEAKRTANGSRSCLRCPVRDVKISLGTVYAFNDLSGTANAAAALRILHIHNAVMVAQVVIFCSIVIVIYFNDSVDVISLKWRYKERKMTKNVPSHFFPSTCTLPYKYRTITCHSWEENAMALHTGSDSLTLAL
jgi:hypothetical protein